MLRDTLAEQLSLGLMLNNIEAASKGSSELDVDCYDEPRFRTLFTAIQEVVKRDNKIDIYKVNQELSTLGQPLSFDDILNIEDKYYFEEKFNSLIEILIECKNKRKLSDDLSTIQIKLKNSNDSFIEIVSDFQLVTHTSSNFQNKISPQDHIKFRERIDQEKRDRAWICTGIPEIDDILTYKLARGEISVLAARPGNGKSATKLNLIEGVCEQGIGAASFALEQTLEVESDRLESLLSGIPAKDLIDMKNWHVGDPRFEKIREAREKVASWNYHLVQGMGKSLNQIKQEMKILHSEGVEIFFFDLFDRIKDIYFSIGNKAQAVSKTLIDTLAITQDLNVHTCVLVQLNRDITKRKIMIPQLADLKDSGAYEEIARTVFFLHYPKAYDRSLVDSNIKFIIAKQNNGELLEKEFGFKADISKLIMEPVEKRPLAGVKTKLKVLGKKDDSK